MYDISRFSSFGWPDNDSLVSKRVAVCIILCNKLLHLTETYLLYDIRFTVEVEFITLRYNQFIKKTIAGSLKNDSPNFDVLLTVHLSIFISVFNQLDAQNLFHNKFYFMPLHVSSVCAHHQEVKIALHSLRHHHSYMCDDTRGCVMQF